MKRSALFCLLLVSSAPLAAEDWDARVTSVKGTVLLFSADGDPEGVLVTKDLPLAAGDRLLTESGANVTFFLDGKHAVYLRAGTEATLASVDRDATEISLAKGSVLGNFSKDGKIAIKTAAADAAVGWGSLIVEVPGEGDPRTVIGVFDDGKVSVQGRTGEPESLIANQETRVDAGKGPRFATQLRTFVKHRGFMRGLRRRLRAGGKSWKPLAGKARTERRGELIRRSLEKAKTKKAAVNKKRVKKAPRKDQIKMEQRKEAIRRRRGKR